MFLIGWLCPLLNTQAVVSLVAVVSFNRGKILLLSSNCSKIGIFSQLCPNSIATQNNEPIILQNLENNNNRDQAKHVIK